MKTCIACGQSKELKEFYTHPRMRDGRLNKCMECCREYAKDKRLVDDSVRERDRQRYKEGKKDESLARYASKIDPEVLKKRKHIYAQVAYALKNGTLERSKTCDMCSKERFCEAAHIDYDRPYMVLWLCRPCHRRFDA
jgi:hypothetical protein